MPGSKYFSLARMSELGRDLLGEDAQPSRLLFQLCFAWKRLSAPSVIDQDQESKKKAMVYSEGTLKRLGGSCGSAKIIQTNWTFGASIRRARLRFHWGFIPTPSTFHRPCSHRASSLSFDSSQGAAELSLALAVK